jgi:hypothetical protein
VASEERSFAALRMTTKDASSGKQRRCGWGTRRFYGGHGVPCPCKSNGHINGAHPANRDGRYPWKRHCGPALRHP